MFIFDQALVKYIGKLITYADTEKFGRYSWFLFIN